MDWLETVRQILNAENVVKLGYVVMTLVIFVETGLLVGFCLPGDSLLVTAGVFASPANAEALRDRLRRAGIDAHTETRVRIGPFKTAAEAQAVSARLRALGLEPVTLPQR